MKKKSKKWYYKDDTGIYNPLKKIIRNELKGWEVAGLTVMSKNPSNKLRNMMCESLKIKGLVFNNKKKKRKDKIKKS